VAAPIGPLPAQVGLYLNALTRGVFEKVEVAFAGKSAKEPGVLHRDLELLLGSYPSLIQGVTWVGQQPWLVERSCFSLHVLDGRRMARNSLRDRIEGRLREIERQISGMDASGGLLVSAGESDFELYLLIDHMHFDGWSINILEADLRSVWMGYPYSTSQSWQVASEVVQDELSRVADIQSDIKLAQSHRPWLPHLMRSAGNSAGAAAKIYMPHAWLQRAATNLGVTEFQVVLAAYGLALAVAFGCRDFVVAVPTAGLRMSDARTVGIAGCYTNTVYVRADVADVSTFDELVALTRRKLLDAMTANIPAIVAIDSEFAAAAMAGEWLVRRLNYPSIDVFSLPSSDMTVFRQIAFPYQVPTSARRLMTLEVSRRDDARLCIYLRTDSGDEGTVHHAALLMEQILRSVAQFLPTVHDLISQAGGQPAAMWDPVGRERNGRVTPTAAAAWLRGILSAEWATQVVPDVLLSEHANGAPLGQMTDSLSLLRAYVFESEAVRGLPVELVRRDARREEIALSRAIYEIGPAR
jgi:Condensation domain